MTTIVGIFDSAENLEEVAKRLAAAELDATILDEAILAQEPRSADPAGAVLVAGAVPEGGAGKEEPNLRPRRDKHSILRDFKARLTQDYHLSDEVIEAYATTLAHSGKFVLVRANEKNAEEAMEILRESGATRV